MPFPLASDRRNLTVTTVTATNRIRRVALVGAGIIGAGWAVRLLAAGISVVATDPSAGAERRFRRAVTAGLEALSMPATALADTAAVSFANSVAGAVVGADFVQESAIEDEAVKRRILVEIDECAPPGVIVASSTSALQPSALQYGMRHPERFLVAHPFNPVYLIPLVELVPGQSTSAATMATTTSFYADIGMTPLTLAVELPGFLANRLQEALWREALWLVRDGVATTAQVDAALTSALGLRWALMGPFETFHLAGGDGGIRQMLEHFGPSLQDPICHAVAPDLTDELTARIGISCDEQFTGHTVASLVVRRDNFLRDLQELLRKYRSTPAV